MDVGGGGGWGRGNDGRRRLKHDTIVVPCLIDANLVSISRRWFSIDPGQKSFIKFAREIRKRICRWRTWPTDQWFRSIGIGIVEIRTIGIEMIEIRTIGIGNIEIRFIGIGIVEIRSIGIGIVEIRTIGIKMTEIRTIGMGIFKNGAQFKSWLYEYRYGNHDRLINLLINGAQVLHLQMNDYKYHYLFTTFVSLWRRNQEKETRVGRQSFNHLFFLFPSLLRYHIFPRTLKVSTWSRSSTTLSTSPRSAWSTLSTTKWRTFSRRWSASSSRETTGRSSTNQESYKYYLDISSHSCFLSFFVFLFLLFSFLSIHKTKMEKKRNALPHWPPARWRRISNYCTLPR